MRGLILLFTLVSLCSPLTAFEQRDPHMILRPKPPSITPLMGIPFGATLQEASEALTESGLRFKEREALDDEHLSYLVRFEDLLPILGVNDGEMKLIFHRNKLIRADLHFEPTYRNFLRIRQQLLGSVGERYSIATQEHVMDDFLKAHLAQLPPEEFGEDAEALIKRSVTEGKTFFFYKIKDKQSHFDMSLAFYSAGDESGTRRPRLQVHFSLQEGMAAFRDDRRALKARAD